MQQKFKEKLDVAVLILFLRIHLSLKSITLFIIWKYFYYFNLYIRIASIFYTIKHQL